MQTITIKDTTSTNMFTGLTKVDGFTVEAGNVRISADWTGHSVRPYMMTMWVNGEEVRCSSYGTLDNAKVAARKWVVSR